MSVGEVFSKAYELWKKDVLWLILAALVIGVIITVIVGILMAIVFGVALSGASVGYNSATDSLSGVGAGMIFLAIITYVIGIFVLMVVGMTFYGGLFEMVLGAARENRPVRFGDLFSGFKKFGSYAVFALVMAGIAIALGLLNILPIIGTIIAIVVMIWIQVIWLYVLPLIADKGMTFGDAQMRSREMVKNAGWWRTFGMIILLGVAIWVVTIIIAIISGAIGNANDTAGSIVGGLLFIVFQAVVFPYAICYIATMYRESEDARPALAGAYGAVPPPPAGAGTFAAPPAPPAPPAPSGTQGAAPAAPTVAQGGSAPAAPVTPTPAAPAAAATAAATTPSAPVTPPVSSPVTPPVTPTETTPSEPAETAQTAATQAPDAPSDAPSEASDAETEGAPKAPAAPEPPASSPPPPPPLT